MIKKTPGRAAFRKSFNRVAALYDKWRPGYPEELFAEIGKITGLGRGSRVLEVGCGTGKATTGMAKCGADMLCIDIGPAMLEIAKKNCSKFGNVKFRRSSFEDFSAEEGTFDLIYFADSVHWLNPSLWRSKCAKLLKKGGHLAILRHLERHDTTPLGLEIKKIRREIAPGMKRPPDALKSSARKIADNADNIRKSGFFAKAVVRSYPVETAFSPKEYTNLLGTISSYITLPSGVRKKLFTGIEDAVTKHGGIKKRKQDCVFILARKK